MTTGRIGIQPIATSDTLLCGRAWRDQRFVAAVALTLAAFVLSEVFAYYATDVAALAPFPSAFRLIALMFALLGAGEALERSQRARSDTVRDLQEHVEQTTAVWQERAHEARSALSAIELAVFAAGRQAEPIPGVPLADAVCAEVALLRDLLVQPERPETIVPFSVAEVAAGPIHIEKLRGATITDALPRHLRAHGRPAAATEIVRNLLENAARHAPGAAVRISAEAGAGRIRVRVEDDGPGIDPARRERIFARGVHRPEHGGRGLGLYISRQLAERQGGSLSIDASRPGTCFVLDLPEAA